MLSPFFFDVPVIASFLPEGECEDEIDPEEGEEGESVSLSVFEDAGGGVTAELSTRSRRDFDEEGRGVG